MVLSDINARAITFPEDTGQYPVDALRRLLAWTSSIDASRVELRSDSPVMIRRYNVNHDVTRGRLRTEEVEAILDSLYEGNGASSGVKRKRAMDFSTAILPDGHRGRRYSYRINAHACQVGVRPGISVVIRPLVDVPRTKEEQGVEPLLDEGMDGGPGLYWITGGTGHGKSTLLGGFVRSWLENPDLDFNILEGSAPIEILYDLIARKRSTICQIDIPTNLETFKDFIETSARKEATHIIVQEVRDAGTMMAAIQAGIMNHRMLASLHTNSIRSTIGRINSLCPPDQREDMANNVAEHSRVIVNQRLVESRDGKRIAIREFVRVDRRLRDSLLDNPVRRWSGLFKDAIADRGQTYDVSIARALKAGLITDAVAGRASREDD